MSQESEYENLYSFLCAEFADVDLENKTDEEAVLSCTNPELTLWHQTIIAEGRTALASGYFPWEKVGDYANRHFETEETARTWLKHMLDLLQSCLDAASGGT